MTQRIVESRNKREDQYAGWRVTGRKCHRISQERAGGHPLVRKCLSLKQWQRLAKGGCGV